MGAPSDTAEQSISGQELIQCLNVMQKIIASGKKFRIEELFVVFETSTTIFNP